MAGKISTLILTVDLDCYICSKKIRKTICKLQGREQIQTVTYDEKNNTVTISGFFDPQKLKKKLLCKACKVIKDIKIKEEEKKPAPAEKPKSSEPEKEKAKPKEAEKEKPKPKEAEKEKPKAKEAEKEKPKAKEAEKEKPKPKEAEKEKPKAVEAEKDKPKPKEAEKEKPKPKEAETEKPQPEPVQPVWPVGPPLPCCCWRPCYEQYYGGCRCCSCGIFFGLAAPPLPPAGGPMGGPSTSTCQFFCEEDPSCTIM